MKFPKYQIGETVFTAHTTLVSPKVDETLEHTIEGIQIHDSIPRVKDGVAYQLSGYSYPKPEEIIHSTREAALKSLKEGRQK